MPSLLIGLTSAEFTAVQSYCVGGSGSVVTLRNSRTGVTYTSIGEAALGEFCNFFVSRALQAYPPSAIISATATVTSAQAAVVAAQATLTALLAPALTGGLQFSITGTNPTIAHGSSGTSTITLVFDDAGYTGTINFSLSGAPAGIAATFSPISLSAAGTTTATVTVASGVATGTYQVEILALDGAGLSNDTIISVIVT